MAYVQMKILVVRCPYLLWDLDGVTDDSDPRFSL